MISIDRLPQTCDIIETSIIITPWGEEQKTENTVYSWIACYLYGQGGNIDDTTLAEDTDLTSAKLLIEWDKSLIRKDMKVIVTDPDIWIIWTYSIQVVQPTRFSDNVVESYQLKLKSI